MLKLKTIIGLAPVVAVLLSVPSCGALLKKDSGDEAPGVPLPQQYAAEVKRDPNAPVTLEFTASYDANPKIDIIAIVDSTARSNTYVNQRLTASWDSFAARLSYLTGDLQMIVVSTYNPAAVAPALPVVAHVDANVTKPIIGSDLSSGQFTAAVVTRMTVAGQGTGAYAPVAIMDYLNKERKKGASGAYGEFPRAGSIKVALLFNGSNVNPADSGDAEDMKAIVADWGTTVISGLVPEKENCIINASPLSETNALKRMQRNLELKLAALTGGFIGSVCQKSYSVAIEEMIAKGSGTQYFSVELPFVAKPDSIKISLEGQEVKEFMYVPEQKILQVSRKIQKDKKFLVTATPKEPYIDPRISTDGGDPNVPKAGGGELSPQELNFVTNIKPILDQKCAGCHPGRNYTGWLSSKSEVQRRIGLDPANAQFMPRGSTLTAAQLTALMSNW